MGVLTLSVLCFKGMSVFLTFKHKYKDTSQINFGILKNLYVTAPFVIMDN